MAMDMNSSAGISIEKIMKKIVEKVLTIPKIFIILSKQS